MNTFKKQRGVSLSGLLTVGAIIISIAMIAFKVIPPYMEYGKIQKTFEAIVQDPALQSATPADIRDSFYKRAITMNNVTSLNTTDIEIDQDNGRLILSAHYSVKVPLSGNVSLLFEFSPHAPKI